LKIATCHRHYRWSALVRSGFLCLLFCVLSLFSPSRPLFAAEDTCKTKLASADNAGEKVDDLPQTYNEDWLSKVVVVPDFDLYYTSLGLHIPLTKDPIPNLGDASESEVYRHLFFHSLNPRFLLLEASVFPMPLAGVGLKKYAPQFYRHAGSGDDFNLIESITTGFPEPYAVTIFIGDIVDFAKPGEKQLAANKGYMGYLFSYSNEHIRRNTLIPDNNYEFEWKLKGERIFRGEQLSWSFRVGAKLHDNPDIKNAVYLGIRRNNMSCSSPFLSWLDNTDLQMRLDFSQSEFTLLRQEYLIGKSYPIKNWQSAFKLDVGLIWESPYLYSNQLRYLDHSGITFVIRPQIEF
jgi:hypothetical protein